jgi:methionyl-tRNA formyltransferase
MKPYVYFGSDSFSLGVLKGLHQTMPPQGVVTQPDRPQGRKQLVKPGPLANFASTNGIPLIQPINLKEKSHQDPILNLKAQLFIVVSFGQILPKSFLARCPDIINGHASLLPKFRGASPIQSAILNGEKESGMTIMHIVQALDAGPMIAQKAFPLSPDESHGSLSQRLIEDTIALLQPLISGDEAILEGKAQDHQAATHCGKLNNTDFKLHPTAMPLAQMDRMIRAFYPLPGSFVRIKTNKGEKNLKILSLENSTSSNPRPGLTKAEGKLWLTGSDYASRSVKEVQMEGKPVMSSQQFLNGFRGELELA